MRTGWSGVLLVVGVAWILTIAATWGVREFALRLNIVSHPKDDRWHRRPVALLGGVAIFLGAMLTSTLFVRHLGELGRLLLLGAGGMFWLGLVDDFLHLRPSTKLAGQIVTGCVLVILGLRVEWTAWPAVNMLLAVIWFIGVTNALNLLDNMDGLCAGITVIGLSAVLFAMGPASGDAGVFAAALIGAGLGFLVFNFNPASVFMGDCGSLFLGASLAILAVAEPVSGNGGLASAVAIPTLLLLIPIFDTTFVTISRKLSARAVSTGGRDHTSHRLVALGFSERGAVLMLYALAGLGAFAAAALSRRTVFGLPAMGLVVATVTLLGVRLARVQVYGGQDFHLLKEGHYTPLLADIAYKGRLFEVTLDFFLIALAYYLAYVVRFDEQFTANHEWLVTSLPIVIACHLTAFFLTGVYRGVWAQFSTPDLLVFAKGIAGGVAGSILVLLGLFRFQGYSRMVFPVHALLLGCFMIGSRVSFRMLGEMAHRGVAEADKVLIYGAGEGGALLVREFRGNLGLRMRPVGFVDDDPAKKGRRVHNVPVLGTLEELPHLLAQHAPERVVISTTKVDPARMERLARICEVSGTPLLQLSLTLQPVEWPSTRHASDRDAPA